MDVRLGDPAHVGGQQPRGASAGVGPGVGGELARPQRPRRRPDSAGVAGILLPLQRPHHPDQRRVLLLSSALRFSPGAPRSPGVQHAPGSGPAPRSQSPGDVRGIFAIHLSGQNAVSRKQSRQRTLVSRARTPCRGLASALECRRAGLQRPVPGPELDGDRRSAPEHAVSRRPDAGRDPARRLRRLRQHRPHHRFRAPGRD